MPWQQEIHFLLSLLCGSISLQHITGRAPTCSWEPVRVTCQQGMNTRMFKAGYSPNLRKTPAMMSISRSTGNWDLTISSLPTSLFLQVLVITLCTANSTTTFRTEEVILLRMPLHAMAAAQEAQ